MLTCSLHYRNRDHHCVPRSRDYYTTVRTFALQFVRPHKTALAVCFTRVFLKRFVNKRTSRRAAMLTQKLLSRQQLSRLSLAIKHSSRRSSQVAVDPEGPSAFEVRLARPKEKKPTRKPFVKNLLIGKFDVEFLAFPEPQTPERHCDFFEWLKPIEEYMKSERVNFREIDKTAEIPEQVLTDLKNLGVLRASVAECYDGLGLNNSEYTKLIEVLSAVPVLGAYFTKRAVIISIIDKFASVSQKSSILPKIARGEIIPALCLSETPSGSMSSPIETRAVLSNDRTFYSLTGRKTYVAGATKANLFVTIAQEASSDEYVTQQCLSAFFVDPNAQGITISEPIATLGQNGLDLCTVSFEDTKISTSDRIGDSTMENELFVAACGEGKHLIGAQAIGILKRFHNLLTESIIDTKNFNSALHGDESLHETIGKVACQLYAMEAMTYLTTGMMDNFEQQDCVVETSLVECHCTRACTETILEGMQIIGSKAYSKEEPFEQFLRDATALKVHDRSSVDSKIFIAILGLQHAGREFANIVRERRNPMFYPLSAIRNAFSISTKEKLYIDENLHPSLRIPATSLEESVNALKKCVVQAFTRNGIVLLNKRMDLRRFAEIMTEIYAMTAVVARASRSYCIGMRNSDHEMRTAMLFTYTTYEKVQMLAKELDECDLANGDRMLKEIAEAIFLKKGYFASHPLERTY